MGMFLYKFLSFQPGFLQRSGKKKNTAKVTKKGVNMGQNFGRSFYRLLFFNRYTLQSCELVLNLRLENDRLNLLTSKNRK
jgi:hypothetical protein